jgi:hypothetical protein
MADMGRHKTPWNDTFSSHLLHSTPESPRRPESAKPQTHPAPEVRGISTSGQFLPLFCCQLPQLFLASHKAKCMMASIVNGITGQTNFGGNQLFPNALRADIRLVVSDSATERVYGANSRSGRRGHSSQDWRESVPLEPFRNDEARRRGCQRRVITLKE